MGLKEFVGLLAEFFSLPSESFVLIVAAGTGLFFAAQKIFSNPEKDDAGRRLVLKLLMCTGRVDSIYHQGVAWLLRGLDRVLGERTLEAAEPLTTVRERWHHPDTQPWTAPAFNAVLLLAVCYPIGGLLVGWMLTGSGTLGNWNLFEGTTPFSARLLGGGGSVAAAIFVGLGVRAFRRDKARAGWVFVTGAVAIAVAGAVAIAGTGAVAVAGSVAGAVAGAIAVAVAVAGTGAGTGAVAVAGSVAAAAAGAVAGAVVAAVVAAGAIAVAVVGVVAVAIAVAVVGVVAVAIAIAALYDHIVKRGRPLTAYCTLCTFAFGGLLTAISLGVELRPQDRALVVFLSILPLFNAPLDWLSLGLTRGLLRELLLQASGTWTRLRRLGLWSVDIAIAVAFMFPLAGTLILAVSALNGLLLANGLAPWIDLPGLLAELRADPLDDRHLWIYVLFLSTLVPTLAHAAIAFIGLVTTLLSFLEPLARMTAEIADGYREGTLVPTGEPKPTDSWNKWIAPAALAFIGMLLVGLISVALVHWPKLAIPITSVGGWLLGFAEWLVMVLPVSYL